MKNPLLRSVWSLLAMSVLLIAISFMWTGCGDRNDLASGPTSSQSSSVLDKDNPLVKAVINVQDRHNVDLMKDPNIVGVMTGLTADGRIGIILLTKNEIPSKGRFVSSLPTNIEGVPVSTEYCGVIHAMKSTAVSHTAKQTAPIQLGTSGGWRYDLANGYCCGGTLGSLVKIGTAQYILSNYHVFRSDIVSGGNSRVATNGDPIIQPGLIDVNCTATGAQNVATLAGTASLPGSNVDCAIAQVISGMVSTSGSILEIGTISATTIAASVNQAVKKSGRTTGLSRSTISGLNASVSVQYENECAGGTAFTKTFTGQIVVKNSRSAFLNSGDSGSLMVQDVTTNPKAVGLLFAGSSTQAIANPISSVLSFLGATMVGN